jgi:hypothetical protein
MKIITNMNILEGEKVSSYYGGIIILFDKMTSGTQDARGYE